jgi:alkylation response protein AidB-like acyl-CoA dehydrogenase
MSDTHTSASATSGPDADETAAVPDLDAYRRQARTWLAEHFDKRDGPWEHHEIDYYTPEVMATNRERQRTLFEGGYAGITWPKEYGGQGLSDEYEAAFSDEANVYLLPDFGILSGTTFHICVPTMMAYGQPEFLRDFVPKVLAGEALVCQFFSEPSSGSDLAGARTRATKDGEQWVINGQKIWSTYAHLSDWGFCLARSNWDVPKHRGLTWFAIPSDAAGVTIRPIRQINETSEFCEDFFDDVVVPDTNRIGDVDQGWTVTQTMLVFERGAGRPVGNRDGFRLGRLAPDLVELARRSGVLGDPVVRQKLARAHSIDVVGRALASRIGELGRLGRLDAGVAAYGKLFQGTYNPIRARLGVEIGGVEAMAWDSFDEHGADTSLSYLNSRIMSIAGGTNEMQRNGIGERALGLPREPSFDTKKPFSQVLRDAQEWTGTT